VLAEQQPLWIKRLDHLHLLTPLRILIIVVVALLATIVVRWPIRRALDRMVGHPGGRETGRAGSRQRALTSVMRSTLIGVIWAVTIITVVGELGVNIGGVIATATVIGGALAFGAQTLIRDLIAGFFVLAEDQYGVGDFVDLGLATGTVERITLRSVQLRDGDGRVWHVPHGNVQRSANNSRSPMVHLDVEVARSMSVPDVTAVVETLSRELVESIGDALTGAPKTVGITKIGDDRIVLRVSVSTQPSRQDEVRRAWRVLSLHAFERGDLTIPGASTAAAMVESGEPPASAAPLPGD
jgi:small conductance mechanosensitive channel